MFMLIPSSVVPDCFEMGRIDAATDGSSTQIMTNVLESASVMDRWETALPKAKAVLRNFGYDIVDAEAEEHVKHFYQTMRHGMCFDWMLNYVCTRILRVFPFSRIFEFGGTKDFINEFYDDKVFTEELAEIEIELNAVLDWVFEGYPDRQVYTRLSKITGSSVEAALFALSNMPEMGDGSPYVIPVKTASRVNYLALLLELFGQAVGFVKREVWHQDFEDIKNGVTKNLIVVGNKFEAFAYGSISDSDVKWHRFENGIKMLGYSERQQRSGYIRAFPDTMTFFRVQNSTLYVDESLFPQVSFDGGETWLTGNTFGEQKGVEVDKPTKMMVRYPFAPMYDDVGKKVIKIKGNLNCVVKDETVTLDENNCAETQVMFRGNKVSFKISDSDKKYPFTFFTSSNMIITNLEWL